MTIEPSMLLISSHREGAPTFRMMPVTLECPYGEIVYVPQIKALEIYHKHQVEAFHMMPKLDDNGDMKRAPKPRADGNPYMQERKTLTTPHVTYITNMPEIESFVKMFAINQEFDIRPFMAEPKAEIIQQPGAPKIILPN